jgi:twitching motility protein PilT
MSPTSLATNPPNDGSTRSAPVLAAVVNSASRIAPLSAEYLSSAAPAQILDQILLICVVDDASDLHLAAGLPPYIRIHGQLAPLEGSASFSPELVEQLSAELARRMHRPPLGECGSLDGAITSAEGTRFRFNIFRRQGDLAVALRRLEERFRSLPELGFSEDLYSLCDLPDGLVVVAGPTGAGKSTTLAALLDRINQSRRCHMVTIEDPIEYLHQSAMSLVNQRQVGADTDSFYEALVASLRQDPDVILVGEIRDLNTIRTAIIAAETGHLVFTTVHAGDCVGTIERLVSVFPADEQHGIRRQLALVLRAVIAQQLLICDGTAPIRALDNTAPATVTATVTAAVTAAATDDSSDPTGMIPRRRGRVAASEVLLINSAVANLIATGKSAQIYSAMETGGHQGMRTFDEDLARLWSTGRISEATATTMARNPSVLRDRYQVHRNSLHPVAPRGVLR